MHVLSYFTELRPCETFISIKHRRASTWRAHAFLVAARSLQPHSLGSARSLPHSHDRVPPAHSRVLSRQEAQRRVVLLCFAMFRRFALGFEGGFIQQFSLLVRVHGLGFDDSASSNGRAVYYCQDVTARALVSLPCLRARPIVPVGVTASSYPTSGSYDVAVGAHGFPLSP